MEDDGGADKWGIRCWLCVTERRGIEETDEVEVDEVDGGSGRVKERRLMAQTFVLTDFWGGEGDSRDLEMIGE